MSNALSSWASVDPELLQARLGTLTDARERHQVVTIVTASFACLTKIQGVDFGRLERSNAKTAQQLWTEIADEVGALWRTIDELQNNLKPLIDEHEMRLGDAEGELMFEESGEALQAAVQASARIADKRAPLTPLQRIGETAWATSFVLAGEIDAFRKRLPALLKVPDPWELIGDLQDHLGHVKAAINAILTGIYSSLPSVSVDGRPDQQNVELFASRELRARIFELRDRILEVERAMETTPAGQWQELLSRSFTDIERFMFGPGFAWMRAGDKRTFIRQHRSLAELLELWSPLRALPAKRAVQNLARYLEALEIINQRECLILHDRGALGVVVARIGEALGCVGQERREAIAAGLAALAEVQGRDRTLDALLEQMLAPGSPVPLEQILDRAKALFVQLGGKLEG